MPFGLLLRLQFLLHYTSLLFQVFYQELDRHLLVYLTLLLKPSRLTYQLSVHFVFLKQVLENFGNFLLKLNFQVLRLLLLHLTVLDMQLVFQAFYLSYLHQQLLTICHTLFVVEILPLYLCLAQLRNQLL